VNIITICFLVYLPYNKNIFGEYRDAEAVLSLIDYSPLWRTMTERGITQYQLLKQGIDNKTLDSLKKGKNITMITLEKLCTIIGCTPNDIVQFIED